MLIYDLDKLSDVEPEIVEYIRNNNENLEVNYINLSNIIDYDIYPNYVDRILRAYELAENNDNLQKMFFQDIGKVIVANIISNCTKEIEI